MTDHVPVPFTGDAAVYVADLEAHGLRAGAVNADMGHLNDPDLSREALAESVRPLVALAAATGGALCSTRAPRSPPASRRRSKT